MAPLGFRLCSAESVLQCLQGVPQVWIHGTWTGPFHKSHWNWSDAEESGGTVSTLWLQNPIPKLSVSNQMTESLVIGDQFPFFLCLGLGLAWAQSTSKVQFHVSLVFQVVLNKAQFVSICKLDRSLGAAILRDSSWKNGWIWWWIGWIHLYTGTPSPNSDLWWSLDIFGLPLQATWARVSMFDNCSASPWLCGFMRIG